MMGDLEAVRLCAEAMNVPIGNPNDPLRFFDDSGMHYWNPLHDDAQAMALVKRFRLGINAHNTDYQVWSQEREVSNQIAGETCKFSADLNRAIVHCVAAMQKEKK